MNSVPEKGPLLLEHGLNASGGKQVKSVDKEKLAKILSFVQKRRKLRGASATRLVHLRLEDGDLDELYEKMECQDCSKIPHTLRRYSCLRGHFYCDMCFRKRQEKYGRENPHALEQLAICGHSMDPQKASFIGCSHGIIPKGTPAPILDELKKKVKLEREEERCLLVLQNVSYDADPLYANLFGNAKWQCPFVGEEGEDKWCANKGVEGWYIHRHIRICYEKYVEK